MLIIGCDFHSGFQQIAIFDNQTGEIQEKMLTFPRAPSVEDVPTQPSSDTEYVVVPGQCAAMLKSYPMGGR
jgi:hypothetical protein